MSSVFVKTLEGMHGIHYSIPYHGVNPRAEPRHMFTNNIVRTVKISVNPLAMLSHIQATVFTLTGQCVLSFVSSLKTGNASLSIKLALLVYDSSTTITLIASGLLNNVAFHVLSHCSNISARKPCRAAYSAVTNK